MSKTIVDQQAANDADDLLTFMQISRLETEGVVYVQDEQGRTMNRLRLVRESLTDGSKVYNLVVGFS